MNDSSFIDAIRRHVRRPEFRPATKSELARELEIPSGDRAEFRQALRWLEEKGELADYLKLVSSYESANWEEFTSVISKININEKDIPEFYQDAVNWADSYLI